jgi:hypothetical protein
MLLADVRKDFEVEYRFFTPEEGGRSIMPAQGIYKSDWSYGGDDIRETGIYMIWPIFMSEKGEFVEYGLRVSRTGRAQMHIVDEELRGTLHAQRIKPGTAGYFMEGPQRVAEATVTKVIELT